MISSPSEEATIIMMAAVWQPFKNIVTSSLNWALSRSTFTAGSLLQRVLPLYSTIVSDQRRPLCKIWSAESKNKENRYLEIFVGSESVENLNFPVISQHKAVYSYLIVVYSFKNHHTQRGVCRQTLSCYLVTDKLSSQIVTLHCLQAQNFIKARKKFE